MLHRPRLQYISKTALLFPLFPIPVATQEAGPTHLAIFTVFFLRNQSISSWFYSTRFYLNRAYKRRCANQTLFTTQVTRETRRTLCPSSLLSSQANTYADCSPLPDISHFNLTTSLHNLLEKTHCFSAPLFFYILGYWHLTDISFKPTSSSILSSGGLSLTKPISPFFPCTPFFFVRVGDTFHIPLGPYSAWSRFFSYMFYWILNEVFLLSVSRHKSGHRSTARGPPDH